MKAKKVIALLLTLAALLSLCACGAAAPVQPESAVPANEPAPASPVEAATPAEAAVDTNVTITDMIGREVAVTPGAYKRVVCIGAGALRMYCYVGDTALLCGVEDIDNPSLSERPKMFDAVARPYVLAYGDVFAALPSCGTGGPNAQTAEAEKILACAREMGYAHVYLYTLLEGYYEKLGWEFMGFSPEIDGSVEKVYRHSTE